MMKYPGTVCCQLQVYNNTNDPSVTRRYLFFLHKSIGRFLSYDQSENFSYFFFYFYAYENCTNSESKFAEGVLE
jgi:hypothetical protein